MMYNRVHPPLDTGRINIMVVEVSVDAVNSWNISLGKEKVWMGKCRYESVDGKVLRDASFALDPRVAVGAHLSRATAI